MPLYQYQEKVKELLLAGKSVILQAPTGAGKTRAALSPFIESFFDKEPDFFPRKCIYSVPMRVLANQFVAEYHDLAKTYQRKFRGKALSVKIQTGDRPDDQQFEGDLIFTTIDQTLSSFLNVPYSLGKRRANLNAGAIVSSYLVFDELHLYDPDTTLATTLEMLKMLKGIVPFIVMTATFSSSMLDDLGSLLDAEVVPSTTTARLNMEQIGSQVGKDRRFTAVDVPLTADRVLSHDVPRTLCICNTVNSAQRLHDELYDALEEQINAGEVELHLLHARFYKHDRDQKEDWIRAQFGIRQNEYTGKKLIQVATQVIEVGVDATCDVLHTELAPASSLLQRAGRCARREHENGRVLVYLPRDDEGNPYYMPYGIEERSRQLCERTWEALQTVEFADVNMTFRKEQALIDQVHKPVDEAILSELQQARYQRQDKMLKSMRDWESGRSLVPELIRDINNCFVFIHPQPMSDESLTTNPWHYDGFSLYPNTIAGAFHHLGGEGRLWGAKPAEDDEAPANGRTYRWYPIHDVGEIYSSSVLAVCPTLAGYDDKTGFRFVDNEVEDVDEYRPPKREKQNFREWFTYELETYAEHVTGLHRAYVSGISDRRKRFAPIKDEIAFVVKRLEENGRFNLTPGLIDQMCRALFATHDLGKLNTQWQAWAHEWQRQVGQFYGEDMSLPESYMAAHTKYDPRNKAQWQTQNSVKPKRPPHAGESAMASIEILEELCGESEALFHAALYAIARHHTPSVDSHQPYRHHHAAAQAIQEGLQAVGLPTALAANVPERVTNEDSLQTFTLNLSDNGMRWLYFLLIRVLRLADQRSQI